MITLHTINELQTQLTPHQKKEETIGFVPTMGALHEGHIQLVREAKEKCNCVIVSIFVNPTQFNNPDDLKKYPRQLDKDLTLLEKNDCDYVFLPEESEIYPPHLPKISITLGAIGEVMEGQFRPHHFDGVVNVVARLFELIQPTKAFFGRKDFQQVAVVRKMVDELHLPVEIIDSPIVRSESGLALSSRNQRLSEQDKEAAVVISATLKKGLEWAKKYPPIVVLNKMKECFTHPQVKLEYLQIVNPSTLENVNQYWVPGATACIAAYCGEVRLIDNMELTPKGK